jgi:hypothetical protein
MADFLTHEKKIYIPPSLYKITTGTWTLTSTSGIIYQLKTATAETSVISIPISIPDLSSEFGTKLKSIKVPLRITTADLSGVAAGSLYLINDYKAVAAAGVNIDTTAVTITEAGTAVTAAATDRLYTATITTPAWDYTSTVTDKHYQLDLSLPCAASTVVRAYGAWAIFDDLG